MKNFIFVVILIFVTACSVSKRYDTPDVELTWDTDKIQYIPNLLDTIMYIPIDKNAYLANFDKLIIHNDTIFILDFNGTKKLMAFDFKGKFLFQVGDRGKGAGEYLEIRNFTIKNNSIFCIDNMSGYLLEYSKINGKYIKRFKMPIVADDMVTLNNGDFIFYLAKPFAGTILSKKQKNFKVFITDDNLNIKKYLLPYSENDYSLISQVSSLSDTGNEILISEYTNDFIYSINKDEPDSITIYKFDFGKNKIPNKENDFNNLEQYSYISSTIYAIDSLLVGCVNTAKNPFGVFIFNTKTYEKYINNSINKENKMFANKYMLPISGTYKDYVIASVNSYSMYEDLIEYGFIRATANVEEHLATGNSMLILYHIK